MDKYYGNVCELDIIFNFQKAYFILDELLLAGEMQESSKKNVLRCISQEDSLEDMEVSGKGFSLPPRTIRILDFVICRNLQNTLSLPRLIPCVCLAGRGGGYQDWVNAGSEAPSSSAWSSFSVNVITLASAVLT